MKFNGAIFCVTLLVGAGFLGHLVAKNFSQITQFFSVTSYEYLAEPVWLTDNTDFPNVEWTELIPQNELKIIGRYQTGPAKTVSDLTQQILNSIHSSGDTEYQQALISTNTVASLADTTASISGFVVPIDFYPSQNPKFIFIVPYFGACLHFPPPAPNQMLFVRLEDNFTDFDINQAYTFHGKIGIELFEDLLGTSAYSMEVSHIKAFHGHPDTFRDHENTIR